MTDTLQVKNVIEDDLVRKLMELMRPSDKQPTLLDDGSLVQHTMRLSGDEEPTAHMVVHPRHGLRWVAARDVRGGTLLMVEEPLVYVSTLDDTRDEPLAERMVRRLFPERPRRATSIHRLFERRHDVFGDEESPTRLSKSLEWTLTYLLLRDCDPDEVHNRVSRMRRAGPYAFGEQLKAHYDSMPRLLDEIKAMRAELAKLDAIASGADNADELKRELPQLWTAAKDGNDAVDLWNDTEADARRRELQSAIPAAKADFDGRHRAFANERRWVDTIRRSARGGRDTYSTKEVLDVYSTLTAAAVHMRLPVSNTVIGMAVYPGVSHVQHSCVPTCRLVVGEGGVARIEAACDVSAGDVLTIDRVLHDEPFVRCLATAPEWMRVVHDATIGSRCRCDECEAAYAWMREAAEGSSASVELAQRAIEALWCDPDVTLPRQPLDAEADELLSEGALRLQRLAAWGQIVDACGASYLRALFDHQTLTLRAAELARATVAFAARYPVYALRELGAELIEVAATYQRRQGERLLVGKLREQGTSQALIHRRLGESRARSLLTAFIAHAAPLVAEVNASADGVDALAERLRPLMRERHGREFATAFGYIAYAAESPPVERTDLGPAATESALHRLRVESFYSSVVGMAAALLDFHEFDEAAQTQAQESTSEAV